MKINGIRAYEVSDIETDSAIVFGDWSRWVTVTVITELDQKSFFVTIMNIATTVRSVTFDPASNTVRIEAEFS